VFFNDAWNWTDDAAAANADLANGLVNRLIDLQTVALHELGHTIGLGHEDRVPSVMATYYDGVERMLFADDIAGVTALYSSSGGKGGKGGKGGPPNRLIGDEADWSLTGVTYMDPDGFANGVPEPASLSVLALGALAFLRRRRGCRG
jgi:hypothetical protein